VRYSRYLIIILSFCVSLPLLANNRFDNPSVDTFIHKMALKYHYPEKDIRAILQQAQYRADVIAHMNKPYEAKPWPQYKHHFIDQKVIASGACFWRKNHRLLYSAQRRFHVPVKIIVGILGVESKFGASLGKYRVLNALTTLSFYYPAQTDFFQAQLMAFIQYCKKNHLSPTGVRGSYAGAIGQPQFMPSSIQNYAVNNKNTKSIDLTKHEGDIIDSIANYLSKNHWHFNEPIVVLAHIQSGKALPANLFKEARSIKQFKALGIIPSIHINPALTAKLLTIQVGPRKAYWLTFHNFDVIKTYNHSNLYALATTLLGTDVKNALRHRSISPQDTHE
jgi:membrane-bound lytic murein transglycosylase B